MQNAVKLRTLLERFADPDRYLFATRDFAPVFGDLSDAALNALLSRAQRSGLLVRVCRGIYLYPRAEYPRGLELFHAAARLRADRFNYISLETALSDAGVISQVPVNWVTVMSSGRSHRVSCGRFGTIEFVHTKKLSADLWRMLSYDGRCRMWRASVQLAVREMRATHRSVDLVDWRVVDEHVG